MGQKHSILGRLRGNSRANCAHRISSDRRGFLARSFGGVGEGSASWRDPAELLRSRPPESSVLLWRFFTGMPNPDGAGVLLFDDFGGLDSASRRDRRFPSPRSGPSGGFRFEEATSFEPSFPLFRRLRILRISDSEESLGELVDRTSDLRSVHSTRRIRTVFLGSFRCGTQALAL